jgi:hypothetical protein
MMPALSIAWAFLSKLPWKWIGIGLAILAVLGAVDHHARMAENARLTAKWQPKLSKALEALNNSAANFRKASDQARANNHVYVVRINSLQDKITKESNDEASTRFAAAHDAVARWVRDHPAPSNPVHPSEGGASGIPAASGKPDADPTLTIVPAADLDACGQWIVIGTGLQKWIKDQAAIKREDN